MLGGWREEKGTRLPDVKKERESSKSRKAKEKEVTFSRKVRLIMTCHHDVSSAHLRHLRVLLEITQSLASLLWAVCQRKSFAVFLIGSNFTNI